MKTYDGPLDEYKRLFNKKLCSCRVVVECAFGRLQGRFRCLSKELNVDYRFVPSLVAACCTLHNILENRGDPLPRYQNRAEQNNYQQPEREHYEDHNNDYSAAKVIRDALLKNFMTWLRNN